MITRRMTRSMSREQTPAPQGITDENPARRRAVTPMRSTVQPRQSFAYGATGRAASPSGRLTPEGEDAAADAITGVVTVSRGEEELGGDAQGAILPKIEEEDESSSIDAGVSGEPSGAGAQPAAGQQPSTSQSITYTAEVRTGNSAATPAPASSFELGNLLKLLLVFLGTIIVCQLAVTPIPEAPWSSLSDKIKGPVRFANTTTPNVTAEEYRAMVTKFARIDYIPGISTEEYYSLHSRLDYVDESIAKLEKATRSASHLENPQVNYFALGFGTLVDPYLTSPTKPLNPYPVFNLFDPISWFYGPEYYSIAPGPTSALLPWDDHGDCWCASPSAPTGGKSQIGILLARKVVPHTLIVEHLPRSRSLTIGSAPKHIEFWVPIPDPVARQAVLNRLHGTEMAKGNPSHVNYADKDLDNNWVRIGVWKYDIYIKNHQQSFRFDLDLGNFGLDVDRVVVRVTSNWSDGLIDYVCLYRLKLYGYNREEFVVG